MTKNEIVGRLKDGGLDASSTNRRAAVYVADAIAGRAVPGWFAFRIVCDSVDTERRARAILSRWYDIDVGGNGVWRMRSKNRVPLMAIKRGVVPPTPPTPTDGPMYFEAVEANSTVSLMSMLTTAPDLEYSTDGETWQEWQHTTAEGMHTFDTLTLTAVGDRVYLRGDNPNGFADMQNRQMSFFSMTGKISAVGNVQSLVDGDTPTLVAKTMPMFSNYIMTGTPSNVLVSTPSLPATTLAEYCYVYMFNGCAGLTQAPSLPATTLAESCYSGMFNGCTGLTQAPSLPATTLEKGCYYGMFNGCTGLTQAPSLPATTLAEHCYYEMFNGCTFNMSDDGTTFNFQCNATLPQTVGEETFTTPEELAAWMGNTNGFTTP